MILKMWPTIVGMSFVIIGLVAWCVYLTVTLFDVRDTAADALDALITAGSRLSGRVAALESPAYPKYLGTLTGSQTGPDHAHVYDDNDEPECTTPDPWAGHDAAVREALTQAQTPLHRTGAIQRDPESSAFFDGEI